MRIIVVAGSKYQNFDTYEFKKDDYLIGIEDGAYEIIKRGFTLDLVLGDFDTTTHLNEILKNANNVIKYPKEKDEIDLELALKYIEEHYSNNEVYIYNATSGRMDHELITIKLLIKYANLNIHLMNGIEEVIYITNSYTINEQNKRFSLIPFNDVELEIIGSLYEIPKTRLSILDCYTSSNKTKDYTTINVYNGGVILVKEV